MKSYKSGLIILGLFCLFEASSQAAISAAEKSLGLSIANKLNSLIRPKIQFAGRNLGWKKASRAQKHNLDFQLLLDSSGSIGSSEFSKAKDAINVIVDFINNKAPISPSGSRVALIEFSSPSKTKLVFGLGDRAYVSDVKSSINSVNYDNGPSTATALALSKARTEFLQSGLSGNAKVVWILTDGKSNSGGSPVSPANQLKTMGVTICAVAVGNRVNMAEINQIASSGCVYKVTSFSSYKRVMQYALKSGGGGAPSPVIDPNFFKGIKFNI